MLCRTNTPPVGVSSPYKREIFVETKRRKTTAAMIHNMLRSLLNSELMPTLHTLYLIYLQLLMESQCHLELISSGEVSRLTCIILYPFFFLLFSQKPQNYQLRRPSFSFNGV